MEFCNGILRAHFQRTNLPISEPIVVHAIAGSGKTTIVRHIINAQPDLVARTLGTPDPRCLSGVRILGPGGDANIVDEYPAANLSEFPSAFLLLADPLQHRRDVKPAHYTGNLSHRFGQNTCALLSSFGIEARSEKVDFVEHVEAYTFEPVGQIIALGQDAELVLNNHSLDFLTPCQALGQTFSTVTLLSDAPLEEQDEVSRYIAITRHTEQLFILT
nr:triple gene block protein 1 [Lily virus X]